MREGQSYLVTILMNQEREPVAFSAREIPFNRQEFDSFDRSAGYKTQEGELIHQHTFLWLGGEDSKIATVSQTTKKDVFHKICYICGCSDSHTPKENRKFLQLLSESVNESFCRRWSERYIAAEGIDLKNLAKVENDFRVKSIVSQHILTLPSTWDKLMGRFTHWLHK